MAMFPLRHARTIRSPAEAEALFRGLGERRVALRGLAARDPAGLRVLVEATAGSAESRGWTTLTFAGGSLTTEGWRALEELAPQRFAYLDVRGPAASLRLWPTQWVVNMTGPRAQLEALLGAPLTEGRHARAATRPALVVREADPGVLYVVADAEAPAQALALFRRVAGEALAHSFIKDPHPSCHGALLRLLIAVGVEVRGDLVLDLARARALTERFADAEVEWQADHTSVDLPSGRLHGFILSPNTSEEDQRRWHAAIDRALRRGGLT